MVLVLGVHATNVLVSGVSTAMLVDALLRETRVPCCNCASDSLAPALLVAAVVTLLSILCSVRRLIGRRSRTIPHVLLILCAVLVYYAHLNLATLLVHVLAPSLLAHCT